MSSRANLKTSQFFQTFVFEMAACSLSYLAIFRPRYLPWKWATDPTDVFLSRIHTRPIYFKLAYLINCLKDTVWINLLMTISEI